MEFAYIALLLLVFVLPALLGGARISYHYQRGTRLSSLWQVQRALPHGGKK